MLKEAEDTLFNRRFSFIDSDGKMVKKPLGATSEIF